MGRTYDTIDPVIQTWLTKQPMFFVATAPLDALKARGPEALSDDGQGGGHFSPLAAYNGKADDLLLMDVARYKYPPFWVDTDLLWQAMATATFRRVKATRMWS